MAVTTGHDPELVRFLPDVFLFRRGDGQPADVLTEIVARWWPHAAQRARSQLVDLLVVLLEPITYPQRPITWDLRDRCTDLVEAWQRQHGLRQAQDVARSA